MVLNKLLCLPPFGVNQTLAMDEVVEILLFATPNSWQAKMEEQNWDLMDHTPTEVIDFMEHLENAKAMDCKSTVMNNGNNNKKPAKKKNSGNSSNGDSNNTYFCKVQGWNPSHTTDQCCKAKKLKAKGEPIKPQNHSPDKSWSCKSEEAKKTSKEELGTLVKEQVAKEMSLYVAQKNKKCSSDSNDGECNVFDLSAFNYKNMNNVSNEVSV
jgi:hypothetical protein